MSRALDRAYAWIPPSTVERWVEREYEVAMKVKRGELVWDPNVVNLNGSRGAYVKPRPESNERERRWSI